jgi:hypothetical protein
MSRDRLPDVLDAQVRAARERGEFDQLPGHGKPLQLDDLDHLPSEQRLAALVMRSMREVPVALSLVREIRSLRKTINQSQCDQERERLLALLQNKLTELAAALKVERLDGKPLAR